LCDQHGEDRQQIHQRGGLARPQLGDAVHPQERRDDGRRDAGEQHQRQAGQADRRRAAHQIIDEQHRQDAANLHQQRVPVIEWNLPALEQYAIRRIRQARQQHQGVADRRAMRQQRGRIAAAEQIAQAQQRQNAAQHAAQGGRFAEQRDAERHGQQRHQ
jgi:hypothetical protein